MSYIQPRPRMMMKRRRRARGLGDFISDLNASLEQHVEVQCLNLANQSQQVQQIDAMTMDLAKNWKPTGFYSPSELATVTQQINGLITQARAAVSVAPQSTSDAQQVILQAIANLDKATGNLALYTAAIATARANGTTAINAPGLKTWVTNSLVDISQAFTTAAVLECRTTWLDTALAIFTTAYNILKRIAGLAIKFADTVLKVADDVLGLYDVLKWGAIGVGALYAIKWLGKMRRS